MPEETLAPRKGEPMIDKWTAVHFGSGFVLGWFTPPVVTLGILVAYEVFEANLRSADPVVQATGKGLFEYESTKNIIADVVAGFLGSCVSRYLKTKV